MMHRTKVLTCVQLVLIFCTVFSSEMSSAQQAIQGAWKLMEESVTSPDTSYTNVQTQPSPLMFTKTHYSLIRVRGNEARQLYANPEERTDAEIVAAYSSISANSGTYEISGSELKRKVMVAKNPNFMAEAPTLTSTYKIEGDSLWLTWKRSDGQSTRAQKYKRLE